MNSLHFIDHTRIKNMCTKMDTHFSLNKAKKDMLRIVDMITSSSKLF